MDKIIPLLLSFTEVFGSEHLKIGRILPDDVCREIEGLLTEYERNMDKWKRPQPSQVRLDSLRYVMVFIILKFS